MALIIAASSPEGLLGRIKETISDGSVTEWSYDSSGDFMLTAEKWQTRGVLRPKIGGSELKLEAVPLSPMTHAIDGALQAEFVKLLLSRFPDQFLYVTATPSF